MSVPRKMSSGLKDRTLLGKKPLYEEISDITYERIVRVIAA